MPTFAFRVPLYTFTLKDGSGALFLRCGSDLFMPLFTSEENATLFKNRGDLDCITVCFEESRSVLEYLENPPDRAGNAPAFQVVVDPVDYESGRELVTFDRAELADSLRRKLKAQTRETDKWEMPQ